MTADAPLAASAARAREREYLRVTSVVSHLLLDVVLFVLFVPVGLAAQLRDLTGGGDTLASRTLFVAALLLIHELASLPVTVMLSYLPNRADGLTKQAPLAWLLDHVVGAAVELTLSAALFLGLYAVFRAFPETWLLWSLLPVLVFVAAAYLLAPLVARLRFRTAPLDDPEVEAVVRDVFRRADVPLLRVSLWKLASKTRGANAALVPRGRGFEVLVSDTMISSVGVRGVRIAVAHELGHLVHRDTRRSVVRIVAQFSATLLAAAALYHLLGTSFGLRGVTDIATLPILLLAFTLVGTFGGLVTNVQKRREEFAADRFALDTTRDPEGFVELMTTLAKGNLSDPDVPRWIEVWLHDHPSTSRRIEAARAWAAALGDG